MHGISLFYTQLYSNVKNTSTKNTKNKLNMHGISLFYTQLYRFVFDKVGQGLTPIVQATLYFFH